MAINLKKDVFEDDIIKIDENKTVVSLEKPEKLVKTVVVEELKQEELKQKELKQEDVKQTVNLNKTNKLVEENNNVDLDSSNENIELKISSINRIKITNPKTTNSAENLGKVAVRLIHGNRVQINKGITKRKTKIDCDLSAIILGTDGTIIGTDGIDSCVYWGRKQAYNSGIVLSDDGNGDGLYMEHLYIETSKLPNEAHSIVFVVTIDMGKFNKQCFGFTNALELSVLNVNSESQIDYIEISERFRSFNGLICGCITRVNGKWQYSYIGKPLSNITNVADVLEMFV